MNIFTIDLEKEKKIATDSTSNITSKEETENNFQTFYRPMYSDKLINDTDVILNLDYLPNLEKFNSYAQDEDTKVNGGNLRIISKINTCQIILSKKQMEQFFKTLDNIVYDESESKLREKKQKLSNPTENQTPNFVYSTHDNFNDQTDLFSKISSARVDSPQLSS